MKRERKDSWPQEQLDFIAANYGKISASEISRAMPGDTRRSRNAIVGKAKRLGLHSDIDATGKVNPGIKRGVKPGAVMSRPTAATTFGHGSRPRAVGSGVISSIQSKAKDSPPEEVFIDIKDLVCEPVSLLDRRDDQCCWPLDSGLYCGLKIMEKMSYCPAHYRASIDPRKYRGRIWSVAK